MSVAVLRPRFLTWLYNHNPFYGISAALMLFAVHNAYGDQKVGLINSWLMMGVLAAYTMVLAIIGTLIVRRGKVWEDARSIYVLLLILFLAVSISADDLFATMETPLAGLLLLGCGYLFSAALSEIVLRAAGIQFKQLYRIPYHLLLALFYVAPWWCSPELHPRSTDSLEWTLFLFPTVASALLLLLLPAIRRGPAYVAENGTPWLWPWFPWTAFGVMIAAIALRTFALCMTFAPSGPIWNVSLSGEYRISFDTMWGPYFLIPPALAVLILLLESGLTTGNRELVRRVLAATPVLIVLAIPYSDGPTFRGFLSRFTQTLGSPVWIAMWLQFAFYFVAWLRRARGATLGVFSTLALASVVGPYTLSLNTLTAPQAWPFLLIAVALMAQGVRTRSSPLCTFSCAAMIYALWLVLPATDLAAFRMTICYHLAAAAVIVIGLACRDQFSYVLRIIGSTQLPLAALVALVSPTAVEVSQGWRIAYVILLTAGCFAIARIWRSRWYLYASLSLLALGGYGIALVGFHGAASILGRTAIISFGWSVAALLTAFLISAHKALWLPARLLPRWTNGYPRPAHLAQIERAPTERAQFEPPPDEADPPSGDAS
jgi:hypothetical protein